MQTSRDRILTTHVGSLPRPPEVVDLLFAQEAGDAVDPASLDTALAAAVAAAVDRQVALGIDSVSDGEMSKISYATYVKDRLSGFAGDTPRKPALDLRDLPDLRTKMAAVAGKQTFRRASCVAPVAVADSAPLAADIRHFAAALTAHPGAEGFLNSASPGLVTAFQPNDYYPSNAAYVDAVAEAMKPEYEAIVDAGFLLQLDCPDLAMARHTGFQDLTEAAFLKQAEHQVAARNHARENVPAEKVRMHICWGNYEGPHDHDIALEKIMDIVLQAKPQAILFEASNPRHEHEWIVWRDWNLPDDKILVPGVIGSTTNYVEHPELVAQRIERFAGIVGRERVIAGTDCGFGTFAGIGKMDPDVSWRKLGALVEGARIASGRLWS